MGKGQTALFTVVEPDRGSRKQAKAQIKQARKRLEQAKKDQRRAERDAKFPTPTWGASGPRGKESLRGLGVVAPRAVRATSHTASTAYPSWPVPGWAQTGCSSDETCTAAERSASTRGHCTRPG